MLIPLILALTAAAPPSAVDSLAALQARIEAAKPGDVITVTDGTYTATGPITVKAQGTAGKPIRIVAATAGGVTIAGTDGFDAVSGAAYVEIDGFVFTHRSGKTQVHSGAHHIRFVHDVWECAGDG